MPGRGKKLNAADPAKGRHQSSNSGGTAVTKTPLAITGQTHPTNRTSRWKKNVHAAFRNPGPRHVFSSLPVHPLVLPVSQPATAPSAKHAPEDVNYALYPAIPIFFPQACLDPLQLRGNMA
jgi:hypothetical protein